MKYFIGKRRWDPENVPKEDPMFWFVYHNAPAVFAGAYVLVLMGLIYLIAKMVGL